jgi:hypothetical protein
VKVFALTGLALAALSIPVIVIYSKPAPHPVLAASTSCDPSIARAYPDARLGAAIYVTDAGPDVVTVDIEGSGLRDHRRLSQQITAGHLGARFDFGAIPGIRNSRVNVSSHSWSCDLVPPPSWGIPTK